MNSNSKSESTQKGIASTVPNNTRKAPPTNLVAAVAPNEQQQALVLRTQQAPKAQQTFKMQQASKAQQTPTTQQTSKAQQAFKTQQQNRAPHQPKKQQAPKAQQQMARKPPPVPDNLAVLTQLSSNAGQVATALQSMTQRLNAERNRLAGKVCKLETEKRYLVDQIVAFNKEQCTKDKLLEDARSKIQSLEAAIKSAETHYNSQLSTKSKALEHGLGRFQSTKKDLEEHKALLVEQKGEIETTKAALSTKNQAMEAAEKALYEKSKALEAARSTIKSTEKALYEHKGIVAKRVGEIKTMSAAHQNELSTKNKLLEGARNSIQSMTKSLDEHKALLSEKKDDVKNMSITFKSQQSQLQEASSKIQSLTAALDEQKTLLAKKDEGAKSMATTLDKHDVVLTKEAEENKALKDSNKALTDELHSKAAFVEKLQADLAMMQKEKDAQGGQAQLFWAYTQIVDSAAAQITALKKESGEELPGGLVVELPNMPAPRVLEQDMESAVPPVAMSATNKRKSPSTAEDEVEEGELLAGKSKKASKKFKKRVYDLISKEDIATRPTQSGPAVVLAYALRVSENHGSTTLDRMERLSKSIDEVSEVDLAQIFNRSFIKYVGDYVGKFKIKANAVLKEVATLKELSHAAIDISFIKYMGEKDKGSWDEVSRALLDYLGEAADASPEVSVSA